MENKILTVEIIQVMDYALVGIYNDERIYIGINQLSWKKPLLKSQMPKIGDFISVLVTSKFDKQQYHNDCNYIGSVKAINPKQNPWYNASEYKIGDEFIGTIQEINSFGCWATHPKGADVKLTEDVSKLGFKISCKVKIKITNITPGISIEGEIIM